MGKTVDLRTELPGPKSQEILARKERVIAEAKSIYLPIAIDRGAGATVTDVDGNTFLDWTGGIGCLNVGHANPAVSAALHAQVDRFLHTDFTMVPYESYVELAERLLAVTPIAGRRSARRSSTPAPRPSRTPSRSRSTRPGGTRSSRSTARSTAAR